MKAYQLNADGYLFVTELQKRIMNYFDKRENELRNDDPDGKHINERVENLHAWRNIREIIFSDIDIKQEN